MNLEKQLFISHFSTILSGMSVVSLLELAIDNRLLKIPPTCLKRRANLRVKGWREGTLREWMGTWNRLMKIKRYFYFNRKEGKKSKARTKIVRPTFVKSHQSNEAKRRREGRDLALGIALEMKRIREENVFFVNWSAPCTVFCCIHFGSRGPLKCKKEAEESEFSSSKWARRPLIGWVTVFPSKRIVNNFEWPFYSPPYHSISPRRLSIELKT